MALTRAQLLAGNSSQGIVLSGQVQGVTAGTGITIDTNGVISVDSSTSQGLVKLNNSSAFNSYVWPGAPIAGKFLQTDAAGLLSWAAPQGAAVVTVQAQPAPVPADLGELWFDCSTGTLNVYQNCVGSPSPNWFNVAQPGLPALPGSTSAVPAFTGGNGTQATPYLCTATTVSAGSSVFIVNTVTVNGLAPFQYVPIVDLNAVANGGRFSFSNYYANSSGSLTFQTIFRDLPTSAPAVVYTAAIRVGYATVYIQSAVTIVSALTTSTGSISGSPQAGSSLTYTTGVASGGSSPYTYAWVWKNDLGATLQTNGGTYLIPGSQIGRTISVTLTATDSASATATATTSPTAVITAASFPSLVWSPTPTNGMNTIPGGESGTYNGTATSITTTGCVEASVAGGSYSTGTQPITSGQTLAVRWSSSALCGGAASNTPISGTLTDGTYTNVYSITVNRIPVPPISDISDTNVALSATTTKAIANPIAGLNTTAYVTYVGTSTGTSISASTDNVTFTPLSTSGTTFSVTNGQTLYIRQTVGATTSTGYTAIIRVGDGSNTAGTYDEFTYTATTVTTAVFPNSPFVPVGGPNASPATVSEPAPFMPTNIEGKSTCSSWGDGSVTLTGTNMVLSIGAGGYGPSINPVNGNAVNVAWSPAYINGLADAAVATGSFTDGTYTNSYTFNVDKNPTWSVPALATNAALSTQQTTGVLTPTGFNAPITVSFAAPGGTDLPMANVGISINGGPTTAITLGTTTVTLNPGDDFRLFGDTGAANSQIYGVAVTLGAAAAQTWQVETTALTPEITTPSITAPSNNSTNLNPSVNSPAGIPYTSSTYTPVNGAPAQNCSDWQVYNAAQDYLPSDEIVTVGAVSPIYSNGFTAPVFDAPSAFDGDLNTFAYGGNGAGPFTLTINFSPALVVTSSLEINWFSRPTIAPTITTTYTVNGGPSQNATDLGGPGWETIFTGAGSVSQVTVTSTFSGASTLLPRIYAFRLDGNILLDGAQTLTLSGNKNLALMQAGDTVIQNNSTGPAYSPSLTAVAGTGGSPDALGFENGYPPTNAFDPNLSTFALSAGSGSTITFTINPAWGLSGALDIYAQNDVQVSVNGGAYGAATTPQTWTQIAANAATVTSFTLKRTGSQPALNMVRVNGVWLQDYSPTGKVYSTNSSTNQIVLRYSSGTWGPGSTGKTVLDLSRANGYNPQTSQITAVGSVVSQPLWYLGLTTDTSFNVAQSNAFDGSDGSYAGASGAGYIRWTPSTPVSYTSSFEYFNQGNSDYQLNGGAPVNFGGTGWQTIATGAGTITTFQVNRGGGAFFSEVRIDGLKLVNGQVNQELTFADSSDFAYMSSGDTLVQNNSGTSSSQSVTWSTSVTCSTSNSTNIAKAFTASGNPPMETVPNSNNIPINLLFQKVVAATSVTVWATFSNNNANWTLSSFDYLKINGVDVSGSVTSTLTPIAGFASNAWKVTYTFSTPTNINSIEFNSSGNNYCAGIYYNGTKLVDGTTWTVQSGAQGSIAVLNTGTSKITLKNPTGTWGPANTGLYGIDTSQFITYASVGPISSTNASTAYAANVLTIAGCASQGMKVGQTISSLNTPDATGVITAISDTSITLSNVTGTWSAGGGQYITTLVGSPIVNVVCDTSNLTSYNVAAALLQTSKKYYTRVRYKSQAPVVTSQWSAWNTVTTASSFALTPGTAMQGGFYVGQIVGAGSTSGPGGLDNLGTLYNLIVAPKATGQSSALYKTTSTGDIPQATASNTSYGFPASNTFNDASHPAFQFVRGLTLGGFTDWYLPSQGEGFFMYSIRPSVATDPAFATGGSEAFDTGNYYWSSTEMPSIPSEARLLNYGTASTGDNTAKAQTFLIRAVRRVLA